MPLDDGGVCDRYQEVYLTRETEPLAAFFLANGIEPEKALVLMADLSHAIASVIGTKQFLSILGLTAEPDESDATQQAADA